MSPCPKLDQLDGAAKRAGLCVGLSVGEPAARDGEGNVVRRHLRALTLSRPESPKVVLHSAVVHHGVEAAADRLLLVLAA